MDTNSGDSLSFSLRADLPVSSHNLRILEELLIFESLCFFLFFRMESWFPVSLFVKMEQEIFVYFMYYSFDRILAIIIIFCNVHKKDISMLFPCFISVLCLFSFPEESG